MVMIVNLMKMIWFECVLNWCVVVVVVIGNVFEWYDFMVFGFMMVVIVELFFFIFSEYLLLLLIIVMFGVVFFMCLIGGIVFGLYVDCVGCKVVLLFVILLMMVGIFLFVIVLFYVVIGIGGLILIVFGCLL